METLSHRTRIFRWIKRFKEDQDDLKDDIKGRPSTSISEENVKAVQDLVEKDRRITIDEIATTLEITYGLAFSILTDQLGQSKLPLDGHQKRCEKTCLFRELNSLWGF